MPVSIYGRRVRRRLAESIEPRFARRRQTTYGRMFGGLMSLRSGSRTVRRCLHVAVVATVALASPQALAAWTEKPFNPKIGSRWTLVSELDRTETRVENGSRGVVALKKTIRAELVFNEKTADGGYRITFTWRDAKASGDPNEVALVKIESAVMNGLAIRAVLDRNGKPLRVENLADIRSKRQEIIDRLSATMSDAQQVAALRRTLEGLTSVDEVGATSHLSDLELLSTAQNTGLRAGETRRTTKETPNGIGPPLAKVRELSIAQTDAATGDVLVLLTEAYSEESMRAFLSVVAKRAGQANADDMQKMKMSLDNRFEIGVVDGMGRTLNETSVTASDLMGNTMTIKDARKVMVAPAQ